MLMFSDSDYGELLQKRLSCCNLIRIHTPQGFILGRTHYNCSFIMFVWLAEMWIRFFFQVLGISSNQIISVTSWKVQCHIVNLIKEGNCYFGMLAVYPQGVVFREREEKSFLFLPHWNVHFLDHCQLFPFLQTFLLLVRNTNY